ncbi:MAG: M15 family metallopeptidase [Melioribacteraceae bacterium]|nr:MAG: M15 family metallopeptidase [Melioribacteraceae bacterium]
MKSSLFYLLIIFLLSNQKFYMQEYSSIIVDSDMTFDEAVAGLEFPLEVRKNLTLINVMYISFDEKIHKGQIVIHKQLSAELKEIFDELLAKRFPIEKVIPIVKYGWDDEKSMADNNSSAFNYRFIAGTEKLSNHAYGFAVDLNPFQNPYIVGKKVSPSGSKYNPKQTGTITAESVIVKIFKKRGWEWGGDWTTKKDYQHFEKSIK